ncbi:hypothetical protein DSCA_52430 [Desulfosarcina alkanivorans]|jgi:cytochrome b|uniref:Cytochrome b561 bacterial/Ni-hydrogenase domain-containing protein n=1 Tax=Desulfosarcina alkanivorans TaxID=571177 RepID=A0A5K7YT86_9BACT|nr:cytochrome b/b6 domain-containing protein [Desulfosarcina alkanivorans]BBO71313.1 hypothetical protein DSCA_52430 [Desulfosarcina alkanivorans]
MTISNSKNKIKVWDIPVRMFHWALVVLIVFQVVTAEVEGRGFALHIFFGYGVLFLILFRFIWGFWGTGYAQFSEFLRSWPVVKQYTIQLLKFSPPRFIGHNPLGGWMIVLLLLGLMVQVITGLPAGSDEAVGPWASLLSAHAGESMAEFHEAFSIVLLCLIAIHIGGVIADWMLTGENLVKAMFTGQKESAGDENPPYQKKVKAPMKNLIFSFCLALILTAALSPAGFAPGNGNARQQGGTQGWKSEARGMLSADEIKRHLEGLGYTKIKEIDFEDGKVEVKATDAQGRMAELYLDPATGQIMRDH